jgi:hypothetical protein
VSDDQAISYLALRPGTPVFSRDGEQVGTVVRVLDNVREHIFDGIDIDTPRHGPRFIDAPEVGRITMARVDLTIDAAEVPQQPPPGPRGASAAVADTARRVGRLFKRR